MAYILHIDTSAETGLTAISSNGLILGEHLSLEARNHASVINHHIESVVAQAGIALKDIDAVAVCGGPGSYTGLRIGLATAKGLCYALDKPLMMHNKLLLLCLHGIYDTEVSAGTYIAVLQAREGEYFAAAYDKTAHTLQEPQHLLAAGLPAFLGNLEGQLWLGGHNDATMNEYLHNRKVMLNTSQQISPIAWAKYAYEEYNCNRIVSLAHAEPFYLKQVYTHKPKSIK